MKKIIMSFFNLFILILGFTIYLIYCKDFANLSKIIIGFFGFNVLMCLLLLLKNYDFKNRKSNRLNLAIILSIFGITSLSCIIGYIVEIMRMSSGFIIYYMFFFGINYGTYIIYDLLSYLDFSKLKFKLKVNKVCFNIIVISCLVILLIISIGTILFYRVIFGLFLIILMVISSIISLLYISNDEQLSKFKAINITLVISLLLLIIPNIITSLMFLSLNIKINIHECIMFLNCDILFIVYSIYLLREVNKKIKTE